MIENELVSVIIPCFNSEKWIIETIDSVLNQTYSNIEIIVVDDGSTDNTKDVISNYSKRIKYIYQQNKGPSVARNLGIKKSKGKYVAFLDSDDLWESNKLEKQVEFLENNQNIALVFSNVKVINEKGEYLYTHYNNIPKDKKEIITAFFLGKITMNTPTIVAHKKAIQKVGGFQEHLPVREDHFLLMNMVDNFNIYHFKEPLVKRRINEGSLSSVVDPDKVFHMLESFVTISMKEFPYLEKYKRNIYSKINISLGTSYWKSGNYKNSKVFIIKSIRLNPLRIRYYLFLLLVFLGIDYNKFESNKLKYRTVGKGIK
ncbi:glycosyltransferase [Sutcliffiella horikoshii]|uniref:Glycosyltransferase n=1 Tax=Sutcliffiella horikoshii TaxID=79883 RepID=A0AA95B6L5_9BACI|nr:glycosyltransferase [Sutcliffiella horikoshii]TYS59867.1 glycosyltransferase [Sutcliffiella horikoshii]